MFTISFLTSAKSLTIVPYNSVFADMRIIWETAQGCDNSRKKNFLQFKAQRKCSVNISTICLSSLLNRICGFKSAVVLSSRDLRDERGHILPFRANENGGKKECQK
jgi:hypothetical protein